MVAAMQFDCEIGPGENYDLNLCLGATGVKNGEYEELISKYTNTETYDTEYALREKNETRMIESYTIDTPDEDVNRMANIWCKQQLSYCVRFSRGWGKGYRDTLQDAQYYRLIENSPDFKERQYYKYRETLASALTHQYADGRGTRKWSPISRENYSDAPAWLIFSVIDYLKESGDIDFLKREFPYLDEGSATVFEHILQAARHLVGDRGRHGMVRVRYGDWNDGITGIGEGGEGESVMNTQMLYGCLRLLDDLCERFELQSPDRFTEKLRTIAAEVHRDINEQAWDGEYYVRAFDDDGNPVGSQQNKEGSIYIESQAFGLSMGIADADRASHVLRSVEEHLEVDYGLRLLAPSYTAFDPGIGRISGHVPGMWENGAVYCHGTAFFIIGLCRMGYGDKALALYKKLLASNPMLPPSKSGLEPYIFTNCFTGPDNLTRPGFARRSWTTGTAAWLLQYLNEGISGIHAEYDGLSVTPCLPSTWPSMKITRWYRDRLFRIQITAEGKGNAVKRVVLNGTELPGNFIPLANTEAENEVLVVVGL